jgi:hypothetical protein
MAFDPDRLLNWDFGEIRQTYTYRDAIMYALGVGLPLAKGESSDLNFLIEDRLRVLPSFNVVLASPGMWPKIPQLEINWVKVLHMAHAVRFHAPLPRDAEVVSKAAVTSIYDRGADKGSVCYLERDLTDAHDGTKYATIVQTVALRGEGGFGGEPLPKAAYLYRLSGDYNPLHADYDVARAAGFKEPILHGLASYGTACAVVLRAFCDGDPARMKSLDLRFAGVVFPGDTLDFACWAEDGRVLFEARIGDRVVLDQGVAEIA